MQMPRYANGVTYGEDCVIFKAIAVYAGLLCVCWLVPRLTVGDHAMGLMGPEWTRMDPSKNSRSPGSALNCCDSLHAARPVSCCCYSTEPPTVAHQCPAAAALSHCAVARIG